MISQASWYNLEPYAAIQCHGDQALNFLQGQLTADLRDLANIPYRRAALCNLQGRIVNIMDVCLIDDVIHLMMPKICVDRVLQCLKKPALFSRVSLSVLYDFTLYGYHDTNFIHAHTGHKPELIYGIAPDTYHRQTPSEMIKPYHLWHLMRLRQHDIQIYPETSEMFLPHELSLEQTSILSFNKGCYRGQEIIARMHYRGQCKYYLADFEVENKDRPAPGTPLTTAEGLRIGTVVDAERVSDQGIILLCSIRKDHPYTFYAGDTHKIDATNPCHRPLNDQS